ncbi:MAG: hypothetical protein F6J98_01965 [Moorea sp. SIO4G2]|nr:hypothetical protein [Moorena sp. SIO4G2]
MVTRETLSIQFPSVAAETLDEVLKALGLSDNVTFTETEVESIENYLTSDGIPKGGILANTNSAGMGGAPANVPPQGLAPKSQEVQILDDRAMNLDQALLHDEEQGTADAIQRVQAYRNSYNATMSALNTRLAQNQQEANETASKRSAEKFQEIMARVNARSSNAVENFDW